MRRNCTHKSYDITFMSVVNEYSNKMIDYHFKFLLHDISFFNTIQCKLRLFFYFFESFTDTIDQCISNSFEQIFRNCVTAN